MANAFACTNINADTNTNTNTNKQWAIKPTQKWALPELKNTLYIFLYDDRKRCTSCPREGEGGGERERER